jgi:hypothetical protein
VRTILLLLYGTGLRVNEVVRLKAIVIWASGGALAQVFPEAGCRRSTACKCGTDEDEAKGARLIPFTRLLTAPRLV